MNSINETFEFCPEHLPSPATIHADARKVVQHLWDPIILEQTRTQDWFQRGLAILSACGAIRDHSKVIAVKEESNAHADDDDAVDDDDEHEAPDPSVYNNQSKFIEYIIAIERMHNVN